MAWVWGSLAGYGSGCWRVGVWVKNLWPVSFKMSPRSCKTDKNWLRYGQKRVVSLSSPFLICFGCFWSHFEGKPVWGWGWGVMGLGCGLFPRHPRENPCYSLVVCIWWHIAVDLQLNFVVTRKIPLHQSISYTTNLAIYSPSCEQVWPPSHMR
jgi:hypothetical protein